MLNRCSDIHLRAILLEILQPSITRFSIRYLSKFSFKSPRSLWVNLGHILPLSETWNSARRRSCCWEERNETFPFSWKRNETFPINWERNKTFPISWERNETFPINWERNKTVPISWERNETFPVNWEGNETFPVNWERNKTFPVNWERNFEQWWC